MTDDAQPRRRFARRGRAAFFEYLTAGMTRRQAASAAAIPFSTLYRWLEGEAFRDECERAEAVCELTLVLRLQRAAMHGSVRAAMFLLERRYPERWGSKGSRTRRRSAS